MDRTIDELITSLKVTVIYSDELDKDAYYMSKFNIIVVNDKLSDFKQKKALLHELKHAASHRNEVALYNIAFSMHSKMEYEAECFVVKELLDDYIQETGLEPSQINRINFLEAYDIDTSYESFVHKRLNYYVDHVNFI